MSRRFANSQELDQRLKDLDRQLRDVQRNLRLAEKGRSLAAPSAATRSLPARPAPDPAYAPPAAPESAARNPAAVAPSFASAPNPMEDKRRFANYFSGSIIAPRPLKHQRRKLRNRAMFMLAVVIGAALLLLRMLFP